MVTDKFHEGKKEGGRVAHESCPSAFSTDYYRAINAVQHWQGVNGKINTSTAEQINSKLRNLEKMQKYAKITNAINRCKAFIELHNAFTKGILTPHH